MTDQRKTSKLPNARTLREAHEVLSHLRPKQNASAQEWLAFRQKSASLYTHIADVDRFHHHEALYWAEREQETANEIATQIQASKSQQPRNTESR